MPISEAHPHRALIPPVAGKTPRPLWAVMIPTYHCARYLRATLEHLLAQDLGPQLMQIEVVDDHSTADDPESVVAEVGQGRIGFYRQPHNVGHIANFTTCLRWSCGQLVHLLHGDDYVLPGFYDRLQCAFDQQPAIGAAFCRQIFMDMHGHWQAFSPLEEQTSGVLVDGLERLALEQRIMTPSVVVRRSVYEQLGSFDQRLVCAEDWEMWVRIAAHYPIWYEVEPLAVYRMHDASNTGRHVRSGEDARYNCLAIDLFSAYLPPHRAASIVGQAKETYALSALHTANLLSSKRDWVAVWAQVREAWRCRCSWRILAQTVRTLARGVINRLRPVIGKKVVET